MVQSRDLQAVIHVARNGAPCAGDHRLADAAAIGGQHGPDAPADRIAQILKHGLAAQQPRRIRALDQDIAIKPSRCPDTLEPQAPAIIIAVRQGGSG